MICVREPPLRHGMELVRAALVTSSLELCLFLKAPGKPHYLHNLPEHLQVKIFAQFSKYTLYLCPHFILLG